MKFRKYFVSNGEIKARVYYSLDNRGDKRKCVTMYAKDYDRRLGKLFKEYENESDLMTDYFDMGRVELFEDHPLYQEARKAVESYKTKK